MLVAAGCGKDKGGDKHLDEGGTDWPETPTDGTIPTYTESGTQIFDGNCANANDQDWVRVASGTGTWGTVSPTLEWENDQKDLDLYLYANDGTTVLAVNTAAGVGPAVVNATATVSQASFLIGVGCSGPGPDGAYTLTVDFP